MKKISSTPITSNSYDMQIPKTSFPKLSKLTYICSIWSLSPHKHISHILQKYQSITSCNIYNYTDNPEPITNSPDTHKNIQRMKLRFKPQDYFLNNLLKYKNLTTLNLKYVDKLTTLNILTEYKNLKYLTLICLNTFPDHFLTSISSTTTHRLTIKRKNTRTNAIIDVSPLKDMTTLQSIKLINFDAYTSQISSAIKVKILKKYKKKIFLPTPRIPPSIPNKN